jgi:hypothetical protein
MLIAKLNNSHLLNIQLSPRQIRKMKSIIKVAFVSGLLDEMGAWR